MLAEQEAKEDHQGSYLNEYRWSSIISCERIVLRGNHLRTGVKMNGKDKKHESENDNRNDEWFKENYIDLMQEHARDWIAVLDQEIIAISSTEMEVQQKAKKIAGGKEFSVYFVAPTSSATDSDYSQR
jgi:hypothetical protein